MFFPRLVLAFLFIFLFTSPAFSVKSGGVEYHDYLFNYTNFDEEKIKIEADENLSRAFDATDPVLKNDLFHRAMKNYYILLKITPDDVDSLDKRALIYDMQERDLLSKSYFSRSLNIDKDNPVTNYLVGDFFYARRDYKRALKYFSIAYENGFYDFEISYKLAVIYEKLGDLCNAKRFYQEAYSYDDSRADILEKIETIPEENAEYHGTIRS